MVVQCTSTRQLTGPRSICELLLLKESNLLKLRPCLLLGSHYRSLSIDLKSHRQKGRSRVDTCLRKPVLGNYLRAVPDVVNMEKEMLETFICV